VEINLQQLESDFAEAVNYDDWSLALRVSSDIGRIFSGSEGSSLTEEQRMRLERMRVIAGFVRLPSLKTETVLGLAEKHLLEAFNIPGYDLSDKIKVFVNFLEIEEEKIEFMQQMVKTLKNNQEILGLGQISVSGRLVEPTIGNWIKDYDEFPTQNLKRGNIDTVNYFAKSPNARGIGKKSQENLGEIFRIFDSFKNIISEYNSAPVTDNIDEAFKDFDLSLMMPGLTREAVKVPAVFASILDQSPSSGAKASANTAPKANPAIVLPKPTPGIAFNALKEDSKAEEIDRKLSELRKKVNKNQQ
jgi:hypothetical protein